jgi:hypothetical protein
LQHFISAVQPAFLPYLNSRNPLLARPRPRAFQERKKAEEAAAQQALHEQYGTTEREIELWQEVLEHLKMQLPIDTFYTYVEGAQLLSLAWIFWFGVTDVHDFVFCREIESLPRTDFTYRYPRVRIARDRKQGEAEFAEDFQRGMHEMGATERDPKQGMTNSG